MAFCSRVVQLLRQCPHLVDLLLPDEHRVYAALLLAILKMGTLAASLCAGLFVLTYCAHWVFFLGLI